jgi:hypothetical protein
MGHRCNLVVKRAGAVAVYYSHWGALSLLADLLKGPSSIDDWVKDCEREEQLLDNVFSEGVALADFDDQLLLLRGGLQVQYILPARLAYLEMARASWPEWRVEWAIRGVIDVAQHAGLPTTGLDQRPLAYPPEDQLQTPGMVGSFTWVTVVGDHRVRGEHPQIHCRRTVSRHGARSGGVHEAARSHVAGGRWRAGGQP